MIVLAAGVVPDVNVEAALSGDVDEALHLGVHVELVLAAVAEVHVELARLHIIRLEHLDGVLAGDFPDHVRAAAEERIGQPLDPHGKY